MDKVRKQPRTGTLRHKWDIVWCDELDECIEKCKICGMKKRNKIFFKKGTLIRDHALKQVFVDNAWTKQTIEHICQDQSTK